MNNIILISGLYGSGKSTVGKIITSILQKQTDSKFGKVLTMPFAEDVKRIAVEFNWDGKKDEKGRKLLQNVGGIGREYDVNIWVRKVWNKMIPVLFEQPNNVLICDDWRFPNEYEFLKSCISISSNVNNNELKVPEPYSINLMTVRVIRNIERDENVLNDPSESSLNDKTFDYDVIIENNYENEYLLVNDVIEKVINKLK